MSLPPNRASKAPRAVVAGIAFMLLGCFLSAGTSALAKGMMLAFPLAQVLLIRNLTAATICSSAVPFRKLRNVPRPGIQVLRMACCGIEAPMYFFAISHLPLVDVLTYYMAGPIYVTAVSALFLGERVGWRRWSAVVIGFVGVLIALRPSAALLSAPALIALGGSLLYAGTLITTRMVKGTPNIILVMSQVTPPLIFAMIAAPLVWMTPTLGAFIVMASLGIGTLITTGCINKSLTLAPASIVVPYQYALIVGGALFGFLFFGETPQVTTLIGAAIIIGAGLYIFMRELKVAPKPAVVEAP
jgi:drug/metabolite transporter (DMT)-like permease